MSMGTALITGATSGIGKEFAWQLAVNHHRLVLVARTQERIEALAAEIKQVANIECEVLVANLATRLGRKLVMERIQTATKENPAVDLLVNNAGFGIGKDFTQNPIKTERAGLTVMVQAVMELTHAALPGMIERGRGAIINVSSVSALTAQGTYSAHKAWVRTFTESLAAEIKGTGVTATALCPGITHTEFHNRQGIPTENWAEVFWSSPELVVESALAAVRRGQVLVTPNPLYKIAAGVLRLSPRWIVRKIAGPKLSAHPNQDAKNHDLDIDKETEKEDDE